MRAAVLHAHHEPLDVRDDVVLDEPGRDEVLVRIAASGVCHSDLSVQDGTFPHPVPCIPGHEGAGIVESVGPGVQSLAPGDHVVLTWIVPCGTCACCARGEPWLCPNGFRNLAVPHHHLDGTALLPGMGTATFAERTVVPADAAIRIEPDVPLDVAALVGCGVTTGLGAVLNTARVEPGSSVAVIGLGGVGLSVLQGACIAGAERVLAVDRVDAKLDTAKRFGATHTVLSDDLADAVQEITGGEGFDYAFEVVGSPGTIRAAWDATRRGGTTCVVGGGRLEDSVGFSPFELFYQDRALIGCIYGSCVPARDFPRFLELWRSGDLDLEGMISRRIDLDDVNQAFAAMQAGEVVRSVIVFE